RLHGVKRPGESVLHVLVLNGVDVGVCPPGVSHYSSSICDHHPGKWVLAVEGECCPSRPRVEKLVIDLLRPGISRRDHSLHYGEHLAAGVGIPGSKAGSDQTVD